MNAADQQLILVAKVRVESRSSNIGTIENFFHRNRIIGLLVDQGSEGAVQQVPRFLYPPILNRYFRRPHSVFALRKWEEITDK